MQNHPPASLEKQKTAKSQLVVTNSNSYSTEKMESRSKIRMLYLSYDFAATCGIAGGMFSMMGYQQWGVFDAYATKDDNIAVITWFDSDTCVLPRVVDF